MKVLPIAYFLILLANLTAVPIPLGPEITVNQTMTKQSTQGLVVLNNDQGFGVRYHGVSGYANF